jgi:hypothetical protein
MKAVLCIIGSIDWSHEPTMQKTTMKMLYGIKSLFLCSAIFCLLPVIGAYFSLPHPLVVITLTLLGGLEATHSQNCQLCCSGELPYLTGSLVDLAFSLLGGMEMELVLSCDQLSCQSCSSTDLLSVIQFLFAQACSFKIDVVILLWCGSKGNVVTVLTD